MSSSSSECSVSVPSLSNSSENPLLLNLTYIELMQKIQKVKAMEATVSVLQAVKMYKIRAVDYWICRLVNDSPKNNDTGPIYIIKVSEKNKIADHS